MSLLILLFLLFCCWIFLVNSVVQSCVLSSMISAQYFKKFSLCWDCHFVNFFFILTTVIITIILNSLLGKSYNSFFFKVGFWRCFLFLCNIFAWFLIFLDVFVGVCSRQSMYPSLSSQSSLVQKWSPPVSLARDSGPLPLTYQNCENW